MGLVGVLLEGHRLEETKRGRGPGIPSPSPLPGCKFFYLKIKHLAGVGAPRPLGAVSCFAGRLRLAAMAK